ncbi:MAG: glycosyltransferase family 2 protein [Syntrophomonadaceae bacterium]|nr:glycosyltransferase family 2 protein [Syntrophomonadaceae bacterium]
MFEGWLFYILTTVVTISEVIIFVFLFYYYFISVAGWWKHSEEKDYNPVKKFALITAAHNEEEVIRYHLDSLKKLSYPKELYDIYVIADNCTDNTAAIASIEGAKVFERTSEKKGKGFALEWMFEQLFSMEAEYDAICLFDADNVVSSNFLLEMNSKLKQGYRSIQGYLDTKNPNDSWVTACYATAYWSMNRMWQLARYNRGLSNALGGTGVCLDYSLIKEHGWGATCLTEDLEFTMKLMLKNGIKTAWAHDAKVYDEKPVYFSQTWRQRSRWLQGHWDVAFRYMMPLIRKGIQEKAWYPIDGAIYLFQPVLVTTMLVNILLGFANALSPTPLYTSLLAEFFTSPVWLMFGILGYLYPMLGLFLEKAPKRAYFYYITYIFYGITWFPVTIYGLIKQGNQSEWAHTKHHRGISIKAIEEDNSEEALAADVVFSANNKEPAQVLQVHSPKPLK